MRGLGRKRPFAFGAIGVVAALLGILAYATEPFERAELGTVDTRYSIRGSEPAPDDIVVVAIDDVSFSDLDQQWPFPRSLHGQLIDSLAEAGARTIAYDVQFTEPTSTRQDNSLIRAVRRAGNVVLATTEVDRRGRSNVFGGERVLRQVGARAGNTIIEPDNDGVWRRFPLAVQGLGGFAIVTAETAGVDPIAPGTFAADGEQIAYHGPTGTFETVSFSRVLDGRVDPSIFNDSIVVIGASAPTLQDVHPTPHGELMPGAEIQANAIASVLRGLPLDTAPSSLGILLIALLGFVAPAAGLRFQALPAFGLAIAAGLAYLLAAQLAFNGGVILPVVDPLVALAIGAVGTLGLHYLLSAFERQRVRDTFARFVPSNVVDQAVASAGENLRLGGVRRESTVLFSDLRGFTAYAESLPPEDVVEVLNRYLGEMTDAIMDHGGTLVSYMGDGIMAVFGAPIEQPDHADRAVAAAREMLDSRLPAFTEWMAEVGRGHGFRLGIGLNSGEVMSGQVGSERRMEYTAIGDTTNTAARLEGMTKETEHQIFVSDSTRAALNDSDGPGLELVGDLAVRGREQEIRVWTLASTPGSRSLDSAYGPSS